MIRSALFVLLILVFVMPGLSAQDCAVKLRDAENLFNAGLVEDVPGLLESCLESGFTREEELSAYKLIIRAYLLDYKQELAEQTMLEFLKSNPEYVISQTDQEDFIYLFNQYKVKPIIQLGLHGGGNFTFASGVVQQSTAGEPGDYSYENDQMSLVLGGDIRFKLNEKLEIGIEIDYSEISFRNIENYLGFGTVDYSEKQRRIETPVCLYYSPTRFGNFIPYIKGGFGTGLNISTTANALFTPTDINNGIRRTGKSESRNDYRTTLDLVATAGLGMKYKLPKGYAFIDVSTRLGIMNQSIPGEIDNLAALYMYTDDLFRLNTVRASIGYIFIIYKPEKIEE